MLSDEIRIISDEFFKEAKDSPKLLEDMASMEKYMSESYSGRIFIELLQNADDSNSSKILVSQIGKDLIFANNGRTFNKKDVTSICRSGSSSKERGKYIGYRGVGFKSTTYLTNDILVYSGNVYFSFSKSICSKTLGISENKVPTIRIPFLEDNIDNNISKAIDMLCKDGYTTAFIFKNAKVDEFEDELLEINTGYFIFLNNILECHINTCKINTNFILSRTKTNNFTCISIESNEKSQWLVSYGDKASIAFKYQNNEIVPCENNEAVYHCYLPTLDKCPFLVKINSDFSTDPSRKHLTHDKLTNIAINNVAEFIVQLILNALSGNLETGFKTILSIFIKTVSFSKTNSILYDCIKSKLLQSNTLKLNNSSLICISEYKLLPSWLENSEKEFVRKNSRLVSSGSLSQKIYDSIDNTDEFISQFSTQQYGQDDFIQMLEDESFCSLINDSTFGKIFAHIIKKAKIDKQINKKDFNYLNIIIPTKKGNAKIERIGDNCISEPLKKSICAELSSSDISWFEEYSDVKINVNDIIDKNNEVSSNSIIASKPSCPIVSHWRSAEQQCIEIESFLGNKAIDVSKKNIGYDIESTTPDGSKKLIEVKLLQGESSSFCITNNEYTCAHQNGDNYFICLIISNGNDNKAIYINNPINNLIFEKRIRQWEWLCEEYSGAVYNFEVK